MLEIGKQEIDQGHDLIRRGVAEFIDHFPENPDLTITTDSTVWRELVLGLRNPVTAFASGDVKFVNNEIVGYYPGDAFHHWPVGTTVTWVTLFLIAYLVIYYLA